MTFSFTERISSPVDRQYSGQQGSLIKPRSLCADSGPRHQRFGAKAGYKILGVKSCEIIALSNRSITDRWALNRYSVKGTFKSRWIVVAQIWYIVNGLSPL